MGRLMSQCILIGQRYLPTFGIIIELVLLVNSNQVEQGRTYCNNRLFSNHSTNETQQNP